MRSREGQFCSYQGPANQELPAFSSVRKRPPASRTSLSTDSLATTASASLRPPAAPRSARPYISPKIRESFDRRYLPHAYRTSLSLRAVVATRPPEGFGAILHTLQQGSGGGFLRCRRLMPEELGREHTRSLTPGRQQLLVAPCSFLTVRERGRRTRPQSARWEFGTPCPPGWKRRRAHGARRQQCVLTERSGHLPW